MTRHDSTRPGKTRRLVSRPSDMNDYRKEGHSKRHIALHCSRGNNTLGCKATTAHEDCALVPRIRKNLDDALIQTLLDYRIQRLALATSHPALQFRCITSRASTSGSLPVHDYRRP